MSEPAINYAAYLASREWALLREKVRQRSGNRCERCWRNPQQAVHHKTYERVGKEELSDLMAICHPCHDFLSAKSDIDPISTGVKIYLAGAISGARWRDEIRADNSCWEWDGDDNWGTTPRALRGGFDYSGPYYTEVHGQLVDDPHGVYVYMGHNHDGPDFTAIRYRCQNAIWHSNAVFAWIDRPDCFGTIWELGYAASQGISVWFASPPEFDNRAMWMAMNACEQVYSVSSPALGWAEFIEDWPLYCRAHAGEVR